MTTTLTTRANYAASKQLCWPRELKNWWHWTTATAAHQTAAAAAAEEAKNSPQKLVGGCEGCVSIPMRDVLAAVQ